MPAAASGSARTRSNLIAVTGMGAVSPFGVGRDALEAAMAEGAEGIRPVDRFSTDAFGVHLAATVPGWPVPAGGVGEMATDFGIAAAREAWADARLEGVARPSRVAVVVGTSVGMHEQAFHQVTERIGDALGADGPRLTVSVACTSSANAIGLGRDLLASGTADVVLAGGTDVLTDELFAGFHALGVLSPVPCAPFSEPTGTTLGEGAGFLVLERAEAAVARGVVPVAFLLGYGLSADAYHATAPDPCGAGVARAIRAALEDGGVPPAEVGYVNAHGTGTESNDPAEWRGIATALGPGTAHFSVSSSKGFLGHAQGAAGVLETICTLMARRRGAVPPTVHFKRARPRCPTDPVASATPAPRAWRYAVCTNSAFGGANAALVIGAEAEPRTEGRTRRELHVTGTAAIGPHGIDQAAFDAALVSGRGMGRHVPSFRLQDLLRGVEARGLDPAATFLSGAAALAFTEGGGGIPRGSARDRTGVVLGAACLSPTAVKEHRASIDAHGLARVSASAFTRMVLNAPAGACTRLLGLRGPTSTLAAGRGAGLLALVYAAEILAWQRSADVIVAAGVDEIETGKDEERTSEGAGCLVLSAGQQAPGTPRLAGWGFSGPGDVAGAATVALRLASLGPGDVDVVHGCFEPARLSAVFGRAVEVRDPRPAMGDAAAAASTYAAIAAAREVRAGRRRVALVADPGDRSAACAVVITAGGSDG